MVIISDRNQWSRTLVDLESPQSNHPGNLVPCQQDAFGLHPCRCSLNAMADKLTSSRIRWGEFIVAHPLLFGVGVFISFLTVLLLV